MSPPKVPESDLRLLYQSLIVRAERRFGEAEEVRLRWDEVVGQVSRDKPGLTRGEATDDRPLSYPFTRGITLLNDGVAYGELIFEKRQRLNEQQIGVTSRRTRTGKVQIYVGAPQLPAAPKVQAAGTRPPPPTTPPPRRPTMSPKKGIGEHEK